MRVVFVVGLILVVLDLDEVGIDGLGVERKADEGVDGGGFGDEAEGPGLWGGEKGGERKVSWRVL